MNPTNKRLDPKVFEMAAHLFGSSYDRQEFIENPEFVPQDTGRIVAVWPAIAQEAFAMTMDNYRRHVAQYNFRTAAENERIDTHNKAVRAYRNANPNLDPTIVQMLKMFHFRNKGHRFARDFNREAEEFCQQHGPVVAMRRIQRVKVATEAVFQNFLHLYNTQLMRRNNEYIRLQVMTPRPIQELDINAHLVANLRRNEVKSLDFCKKTILSHRHRLEECGVLKEYQFRGSRMAVRVHVNPEILTVIDMKTGETLTAGKQHVSPASGKVLPDANESTGPLLKKNERKGNASDSRDKEFAPLTPKDLFLQGHPEQGKNPTEGAAAAGVKISHLAAKLAHPKRRAAQPQHVSGILAAGTAGNGGSCSSERPPTLSEKLERLILHPQDLAERLAAGEFANYAPLDIRILHQEAFRGTLSRTEFRELVIQDFFKNAAKLYRNSTPYVGSWKKAINLYYENKFVDWEGNAFNKATLVPDMTELRYRLEWARKWFANNPAVKPLFPSDYFDMTRKDKREVGFEFTRYKWLEHLKYEEGRELRNKQRARNAELRAKSISQHKKCENEIRRFHRHKITLPQLLDYVSRNLPTEFHDKLPEMIRKEGLRYMK